MFRMAGGRPLLSYLSPFSKRRNSDLNRLKFVPKVLKEVTETTLQFGCN